MNSLGKCEEETHSERQWSFLVTAFDVVSMVSMADLQPLWVVQSDSGLYMVSMYTMCRGHVSMCARYRQGINLPGGSSPGFPPEKILWGDN